MAKKREKKPDEGSPAWMATFSDLMNLLLCFFVLLFASSTVDEGKIQKIAASFEKASFSILPEGAVSLDKGLLVSGGVTQLEGVESLFEYVGKASEATGDNPDSEAGGVTNDDKNTEEDTPEGQTEEQLSEEDLKQQMNDTGKEMSEEMYDEMSEMIESYSIDERVSMDYNSQYVQLDMNGAILFDPGDAELKDDSRIFMQKIASILVRYKDCIIEIEGHTDNVPMNSYKYENNRYLSTARAINVYEYLKEQEPNLIDSNIKVAGYGETRPVASNDTEEGRAKNRRVVIKIYNQLQTEE